MCSINTNTNTNTTNKITDQNVYISEAEESLVEEEEEEGYGDDDLTDDEFEDLIDDGEEADLDDVYLEQLKTQHLSKQLGVKRQLQIVIESIMYAAHAATNHLELQSKYCKEFSLDEIENGDAEHIEGIPEDAKEKVIEITKSKNMLETFLEDDYERKAALPLIRLDSPEPSNLLNWSLEEEKNDSITTTTTKNSPMISNNKKLTNYNQKYKESNLPKNEFSHSDYGSDVTTDVETDIGSGFEIIDLCSIDDLKKLMSVVKKYDQEMMEKENMKMDAVIGKIPKFNIEEKKIDSINITTTTTLPNSFMDKFNNKQNESFSTTASTHDDNTITNNNKNLELDSGIDLIDLCSEFGTDCSSDNMSVCSSDNNNNNVTIDKEPLCFFKRSICPEKVVQKSEEKEKITMKILPPRLSKPANNTSTTITTTKIVEETHNPPSLSKPKQPSPQFSKSSIWGKSVNDEEKVIKSTNKISYEKKKDNFSERTNESSKIDSVHPNESNTKRKDDVVKPKFSSNSIWSTSSKKDSKDSSSISSSNSSFQSKPQFSKSSIWTGKKRAPIQWEHGPTKKSCHSIHWDANNNKNYQSICNDKKVNKNISATTTSSTTTTNYPSTTKSNSTITTTTAAASTIPILIKKDKSSCRDSNTPSISKEKLSKSSIWNTSVGATRTSIWNTTVGAKTSSRINWGFPNEPQPTKKAQAKTSSSSFASIKSKTNNTTSGRTKIFGTPILVK